MSKMVVGEWTESPYTAHDRHTDTIEYRVVIEHYGSTGADVRRLQFAGNLSDTPSGGTLTEVYYLEEHDPVAVVRAFCEVNPHFVDVKSRTGFVRQFGRHGSEFKAAAQTVADEIGLEGRTPTGDLGTKDGVECPRCGKKFPSLPTHLRDGCDG